MLYIENFNKNEHSELMRSFLSARRSYLPPDEEMPALGWVASDLESPVAMAFLRRVEGGYAILDGLVTDPEAPGSLRSKAIDLVVKKVLDTAKELGIKAVTATSVDANTLVRSNKHGFVLLPHSVIIANLSFRS